MTSDGELLTIASCPTPAERAPARATAEADPATSPAVEGSPAPAFCWYAHPARERPLATVLALAVIAALAAGVSLLAAGGLAGLAGAVLLVASLHRYFFPSRFCLDAEGVSASYLFRRQRAARSQVQRVGRDCHGVFLAYRRRASWLDPYRGIHILYGRHRDEVEARLGAWLAEGGR